LATSFILLQWQKSNVLIFIVRQELVPFIFLTQILRLLHFFGVAFKIDITQEGFSTIILYALLVSSVVVLQCVVTLKIVAYSNNSMWRVKIESSSFFKGLYFLFTTSFCCSSIYFYDDIGIADYIESNCVFLLFSWYTIRGIIYFLAFFFFFFFKLCHFICSSSSVICQTTDPQLLPKRFLHLMLLGKVTTVSFTSSNAL
jgi:hypothetical protein